MRVWYRKFQYVSNIEIIRVLKLLIRIGNFDQASNFTKIYNYPKQFILNNNKYKQYIRFDNI